MNLTPGRILAAILAAVIAAGAITIAVTSDDDGQGHKRTAVTIELAGAKDTPAGVPSGPSSMKVPAAALEQAKAAADDHQGLAGERPAGVPEAELLAGVRQQEALAKSDRLPDLTPLAAPEQRGCRTRMVGNYSSRNGVRPRIFVLHYTVSPNRPGFADVDAITGLFNQRSFAASSNYVLDADGNCNYIVREASKAWTQAAANPFAISVEVIDTGSEPVYLKAGGYRQLGVILRDVHRRWGIPLRTGRVSGCGVARAGIVQHRELGPCGGGHADITPFSTASVIRQALAASGAPAVARKYVVQCRKLNSYRREVRRHHRTSGQQRKNARGRKASLRHHHVACTKAGASRA